MPGNNDDSGGSGGGGQLPSGGLPTGNRVQHYELRLPILRTNTLRVRFETTTTSSGTGNVRIHMLTVLGEDRA